MVTAKESRTCPQFSAWNSSHLDHMALMQLEQNYSLPYFPPSKLNANVAAFPGRSASNLPGLNTGQQYGFLKPAPPYCNVSYPNGNPYLKDSQCALSHGFGVSDTPIDDAPQKRFLIFDQSGNKTRLFFSPSFSSKSQIFASNTPSSTNGPFGEMAGRGDRKFSMKPIIEEKWAENKIFASTTPSSAKGPFGEMASTRVDQKFSMKPIIEERWDENNLADHGESEMFEDSEEINALFDSDSDDEYDDNDDDDDDDDDDEVTSTGQSPFIVEEGYNKDEELLEKLEAPKRQKLVDGKYKKSSLAISRSYEDDAESSYAGDRKSYDDDINHSSKRENKVKIRRALKMLESIIPDELHSTDPLSIIDKAIVYLKSMKIEAESLGLGYLGGKSVTLS
ncbi:hypothetical protein DH2020_024026 [Rehmannia glutinosa]|uniref:Uncharacterized protein n=1 Tax=Rehmannia glutinosa TaxID=99300 RepID=A0ABR0W7M9_REHGL